MFYKHDVEKYIHKEISAREMHEIEEKYRGSVPFVENKPEISNYGIRSDFMEIINDHELKEKKVTRGINAIILTFVGFMFIWNIMISGVIEAVLNFAMLLAASILLMFMFMIPYALLILVIMKVIESKEHKDVQNRLVGYLRDIESFRFWQRMRNREYWESLDGYQFERAVARLFQKNDYKVNVTRKSGDGGIDIILAKNDEIVGVQCKAHKKPVGPSVVRDLYGSMVHFGYDRGVLVSLNGFTRGVFAFCEDKKITLLTIDDLVDLTNGVVKI